MFPRASRAAVAALAVFAAGFGALAAFHAVRPADTGLPGLFDFASATWGDSIALPVMTGLLVYAVCGLPAAPRDRRVTVWAALAGAAAGLATEAYFLTAESPALNWTFPRPHHYTAAGWYHAAFLVAMCAVAAALWALALNRALRAGRAARMLSAPLAAGLAFAALYAVDIGRGVIH